MKQIILTIMVLMLASCASNANNDAYGKDVQVEKAAISANQEPTGRNSNEICYN